MHKEEDNNDDEQKEGRETRGEASRGSVVRNEEAGTRVRVIMIRADDGRPEKI
jgi:hypothetical protein